MAPRLPEACSHILETIEETEAYVAGLSESTILQDRMRMRAIERCLEIIAEAVKFIPDEERGRHPQIDWAAITPMGNILRHEYFQVNPEVLLRAVRLELPALKAAVMEMSPVVLRDPPHSESHGEG